MDRDRRQSYTEMIAADTDFYLASPENHHNQIEIEYDDERGKYNHHHHHHSMVNGPHTPDNHAKNHPQPISHPHTCIKTPSTTMSRSITTNSYHDNVVNHTNPVYEDDSQETIDSCHTTGSQSSRASSPYLQQREIGAETAERNSDPDLFRNASLVFGWKCLSFQLCQFLNRPLCFLICLCLSGIAQGFIVTGIAFSVLTSIEKHFGFKSSEAALFGTAYDTAYGICCMFVGYIGHTHKPRGLGWGMLIMAVGAVLLSTPKYIIGTYRAGLEQSTDFCTNSTISLQGVGKCREPKEWYYEFIFVIGNILVGIGATPLYTLAPAHIDDVSSRAQGSLYMGIYYAACAIGPALGYIVGMPILDKWVDLHQPEGSILTPSDANWVGAWWLGYLIGAGLCLLPVIPMLGFPKEFPNTEAVRTKKRELEDSVKEDSNLKHDLKSVWPATLALLKNAPFIFISLAIACESLAIGGFSTFLPKFIQTQFHFTSGDSAFYTGVIAVPGAAGGIFAGGFLIYRFGWNCKQILKSATVMAFVSTLFVLFALVGCTSRKVVGQAEKSGGVSESFTNGCNAGCGCSTDYYKPVCNVAEQKTYYSPCHAGCYKRYSLEKEFFNCTCMSSNGTNRAVAGRCSTECNFFPIFAVGAVLLMFFTFMNNVPLLNATFRVVNEGQGSFAMGFQQIVVRFLGFVPAPVMFGALIDKSCDMWQTDTCTDETASCLEYDNLYFRYYIFALGIVTKFASFVFLMLAVCSYKLPPDTATPPATTPPPPITMAAEYDMDDLAATTTTTAVSSDINV